MSSILNYWSERYRFSVKECSPYKHRKKGEPLCEDCRASESAKVRAIQKRQQEDNALITSCDNCGQRVNATQADEVQRNKGTKILCKDCKDVGAYN